MQKQYTTLRILTETHRKIKILALSEQRTIDIIANRLLNEALDNKVYSKIIGPVLKQDGDN
jgi:hypothetical protein